MVGVASFGRSVDTQSDAFSGEWYNESTRGGNGKYPISRWKGGNKTEKRFMDKVFDCRTDCGRKCSGSEEEMSCVSSEC